MTRKIIGCLLIASPFITIFAYEVYRYGWIQLFLGICGVAIIIIVVHVGVTLVWEDKP